MYKIDHSLSVRYVAIYVSSEEVILRCSQGIVSEEDNYVPTYPTKRSGLSDLCHCTCVEPIEMAGRS